MIIIICEQKYWKVKDCWWGMEDGIIPDILQGIGISMASVNLEIIHPFSEEA